MNLESELYSALNGVIRWTTSAMDVCKPNSGMYADAEREKKWAERLLIELRNYRP